MNSAKKAAPKRKLADKRSNKAGSKTSKSKTTVGKKASRKAQRRGSTAAPVGDSDEEDDVLVTRRAKRPKTGRIGRTAGKKYPKEINDALGRAHLLYIDGHVQEASAELSKVVVQCPSIPEPFALLALIYQDGGQLAQALQFYRLACSRDPKNLGNHRETARIAELLGDHASKLEALKVLARLQPNNLHVAIERARCLVELQKPRQALDIYAKAAKRFPRKYDIYLDLAEAVECASPQQNVVVQQALASCLRRVVGKQYLASEVRDLADGFSARLREIKLEPPKPRRLPPRTHGLPSRREGEVAMTAASLLMGKLMESRKRQEPQYEVAVQVVEGLGSWLDSCRAMARRADRSHESGDGQDGDNELKVDEQLDSDSDIRYDGDGSEDEEEEGEEDGGGGGGGGGGADPDKGNDSSAEDDEPDGDGTDEEDDEDYGPMDCFDLDPGIVLRYGICQLYLGDKEKADKALRFLKEGGANGPHSDMMIEVAKVYAEMGHFEESLELLRHVAQSTHARRCLAGIQLGAAYASRGNHDLAVKAYAAVLAERPHHAAALAGVAEAAYWLGTTAVPMAVSALTPAVERATEVWKDDCPAAPPPEDEDEGEDATGFQRLQLLMQWATFSLMEKNTEDFACVAVPIVCVALGQLAQRQEFELRRAASPTDDDDDAAATAATRSREAARESRAGATKQQGPEAGSKQRKQAADGGEGAGDARDQASRAKRKAPLTWKPTLPVRPILRKMDWQVGFRGKVSALAQRLLGITDVIAQVGRRVIVWHIVEVVRALLELGNSSEAKQLVEVASRPNGLLRGLEKDDLQVVLANPNAAVLVTMPGGSPMHGPATREGLFSGAASAINPADPSEESKCDDPSAAVAEIANVIASPSEQFYPPPWRCVEERDDDGLSGRAGRHWRSISRGLHGGGGGGGARRSRSRALMELDERKDEGDPICAIVRALSRKPGNDATWNLLQRVVTERGVEQGDGGFHGEQMDALVSRHREHPQGLIHRGHDAAGWNRAKHALKLYSHAHFARPEEPLPILCLALHICRMVTVMETMVEEDGVCILQALACLHRYAELRQDQSSAARKGGAGGGGGGTAVSAIPEAVLEQEIMYNLGRGYHQLGLSALAMEYYSKALRVADERGDELRDWHGGEGVTKETAHNMCTLYTRNGQTAMALSILHKYLAVG